MFYFIKQFIIFSLLSSLVLSCQSERDDDVFSFAVSGEFRPFSYVNKQGELDGFDVEVGKLIAEQLGKKQHVAKFKFSGIIEAVKSGRFDAAVASHTITEKRKKHVLFSDPYYYSGPQVFSRGPRVDLSKVKNIAVSKGSTYESFAKKYTHDISYYDSDVTALEALNRGRHDIVITDSITGAFAIKNGLKIHPNQVLGQAEQGIVVAKQNQQLLGEINQTLKKLKQDGVLRKLSFKYFGKDITTPLE